MSTPWKDASLRAKKLSVYLAPSVSGGTWKAIVEKAIAEFNRLAQNNSVNLSLIPSKNSPTDDGGGADIQIEAAQGSIAPSWGGAKSPPQVFSGTQLHGHTEQFIQDNAIQKAFVYVPGTPKINTSKGQRLAGDEVQKLIVIHEFLHACGLEDSDHTQDDIFQGYPNVDAGATPSGDRVRIPGGSMPPFKFGGTTVQRLKSIWP